MDEKKLRKNLKRGIMICLIVGIVILGVGIVILESMNRSLKDMVSNQMKEEAFECKRRIQRQVDKDFQTLYSLSVFLMHTEFTENEQFASVMYEANSTSEFVTAGYFDRDGIGIMVNKEFGIRTEVDYRTLQEEVREVIENAYAGKKGVSDLFDSQVSSQRLFVYAIPIYDKYGSIHGVLTASDHVDLFAEAVGYADLMDGYSSFHLFNQDGSLLITSLPPEYEEKWSEILHSDSFEKDEVARIDRAMHMNRSLFSWMNYEGQEHRVYLEPVSVNGWYIMCVNTKTGTNAAIYRMVHMMGVLSLLLLGVVLFLLFHICRQIIRNNRRLTRFAYKDALTGADNRMRFMQKLGEAGEYEEGYCIAAVNVRQFKYINEIFGTKKADRILQKIVGQMQELVQEDEFFCRVSADQFYLFLRETDPDRIQSRLKALMDGIGEQNAQGKNDYKILLYAGAYIRENGNENVIGERKTEGENKLTGEVQISRARLAMKYSRSLPANQVYFYDEEIHWKEELQNYIEARMYQALEKEEFRLYLQPKVRLEDGSLSGAEALVRWATEEGDTLYPDSFIPIFEQNGFCVRLDLYMVEKVFSLLRSWMDQGIEPLPISVNQSKLLFFDPEYIGTMQKLLEKYRIPAQLVTLEILEGLALDNVEEINRKISRLKEMGFGISMDDFGSGYASFNTLGRLQIDELKLDRSFLLEISNEKDGKMLKIVEHIIALTKSLQIVTVAEGVETKENEEMIRCMGCDFGQGYLYSRPISAEEFCQKYMGEFCL